jgi:hypothetical protein
MVPPSWLESAGRASRYNGKWPRLESEGLWTGFAPRAGLAELADARHREVARRRVYLRRRSDRLTARSHFGTFASVGWVGWAAG